ncbi:hypothetical protein Lmor_3098 [Legionella moravica]|uniref:Uncharacterized protein n=1 Tax=Legionella moravica TaxID=39962 RepID=A0A378K1U1_9GAMM|nr:hypothetical protein [Legionella moravica]KTD30991.1 hypothetical protein Lmor_3098 [Legionella moravica]STX63568.1 Uncharacterised protein [Legionella moravica]
MPRFFKHNSKKTQLVECEDSNSAEFIEIYWNWEAFAIPMVLGLDDALCKFNDRFQRDGTLFSVISPSTWLALFEHNAKYCSPHDAELLSQATLAVRPS